MKTAGALILTCALYACDPIYTARLDVRRTDATRGAPTDSLVAGIAQQAGFSRSSDTDETRCERSWRSHDDWDEHPSRMWVVLEQPADSIWRISIGEWLRMRQSPFGARLQRMLDSTLTEAGYVVTTE